MDDNEYKNEEDDINEYKNKGDDDTELKTFVENYKRRIKSITQQFNLLNIVVVDVNNLSCYISTMLRKIYIIDISDYRNDMKITCTCPDNTYKKNICKHIYWLASKHICVPDPQNWDQDDIDKFILSYSRYFIKTRKGRNDQCPICLKNIDYKNEYTFCCTQICENSIHTICWYRYYLTTYSNKCVICRNKTLPAFVEYNDAGLFIK